MSFRTNLQHLRATRNMTQEQLAMILGVSRQSVTKWESGKSSPEMDKLLKLCEVFGCTLDDLVCGDLTGRPAEPAASMPDAAPADVCGYDEERRSFARSVSSAVCCFVAGPAACTLVDAAGRGLGVPDRVAEAVGAIVLLALVAVGLALVIPAGLRHAAFTRRHPYVEDFYTEADRDRCRAEFTRSLVCGIVFILAGVACCVVLDGLLSLEDLGAGVLLSLVAVGATLIVRGSMLWAAMDLDAYNAEAPEAAGAVPESRRHRVTGGVCGAVMLVATMAGLVMLFVPAYQTPLFWLAWPVGGIVCGVVSCLVTAFMGDE